LAIVGIDDHVDIKLGNIGANKLHANAIQQLIGGSRLR
jgi:hypothetical protein